MKKNLVFWCIPLLLLFGSCRSSKLTKVQIDSRDYQVNANEIGLLIKPVMADLELDQQRKEVEYLGPVKLKISDLKSNAMALFLKTHSCDYVVDPVFTVSTIVQNNFTTQIKIVLNGFPAKYSKIYQVDSLPNSVIQYAELNKNARRLDYFNKYDYTEVVWGVEANLGDYTGVQVDFPLDNSGLRTYISFETIKKDWSYTADIFENREPDPYTASGGNSSYFTLSAGVLKEFPVADFIKMRITSGLNYTRFGLSQKFSASNKINYSSIDNFGIRFGTGLDIKVYKHFSIVGKMHYNLGLANMVFSNDPGHTANATLLVKNIDIKSKPDPNIFLGLGIRVVF